MPDLIIRCQRCGSRRVNSVSEPEAVFWRGGLPFDRFCNICMGLTRWAYAGVCRAGEPIRLLVIDDDSATLTLLQKALSEAKFVVEEADSARGALLKLFNETFDAIISDIRMPGMDGKKLFRFLEEYMPEYRRRIIFLTGDYSEETREFMEKSGRPYSFKPINWEKLIQQVGEVLAEVGFLPRS